MKMYYAETNGNPGILIERHAGISWQEPDGDGTWAGINICTGIDRTVDDIVADLRANAEECLYRDYDFNDQTPLWTSMDSYLADESRHEAFDRTVLHEFWSDSEDMTGAWYAIQWDADDTDWGTGSYDYDRAIDLAHGMLCERIATIEGDICTAIEDLRPDYLWEITEPDLWFTSETAPEDTANILTWDEVLHLARQWGITDIAYRTPSGIRPVWNG